MGCSALLEQVTRLPVGGSARLLLRSNNYATPTRHRARPPLAGPSRRCRPNNVRYAAAAAAAAPVPGKNPSHSILPGTISTKHSGSLISRVGFLRRAPCCAARARSRVPVCGRRLLPHRGPGPQARQQGRNQVRGLPLLRAKAHAVVSRTSRTSARAAAPLRQTKPTPRCTAKPHTYLSG